ncbi:polygalacturonase PglA [Roseicyclus sp.]|uniref:polygalacturonase PglA n=1 Tax=Roseicyclus sp. TaxID=1914329 RepID=UPI003FA1621D
MKTSIRILAATPRSAVALLAEEAHRYRLTRPAAWRIACRDGETVAEGVAQVVPLFLDGLRPATDYRLVTDLGEAGFRTPRCAGMIDVTDHGARADGTDATRAFADALDALSPGGTLHVPPGRFVSAPLFLRSDMVLHLAGGAELAARAEREDWPILPARDARGRVLGTWEGLPEASFAALLSAIDCGRLAITGRGVVDGGGARGDWWTWPKETRDGARRARTLFLSRCRDVAVSGVTIRNSPSWTVHPHLSENLTFAAMAIESPPDSPNTDGLNPESCRDVTVAGVRISVGDDCIAIKAGKRAPGAEDHLAPTQGVTIGNCLLERGHGAVVLGSEMSGDITDVTVARCDFVGTDRGLRIKTRRGRGGRVARIRMSGVVMEDVATPLAVNAFYFCDADGRSEAVQSRAPAPVGPGTPEIDDITLEDVTATGARLAGAALLGLPEAPLTGLRLGRFRVSFRDGAEADVPLMAEGVPEMRHVALFAENAEIDGAVEALPVPEESAPC